MVKQSRCIDLNPEVFRVVSDVVAEMRGVARSTAVRMLRKNVQSFFEGKIIKIENGILVVKGEKNEV